MNEIDRRKLNLLLHLARVDGKFVNSERRLLRQFIEEKGLGIKSLDVDGSQVSFNELGVGYEAKIELLFWAFRLVQADEVIHEKEILFCRNMARKLNFKEEIVNHFINDPLPDFKTFEWEVKSIWMHGL